MSKDTSGVRQAFDQIATPSIIPPLHAIASLNCATRPPHHHLTAGRPAALGSGYSRLVLELSLALRGHVPPHWSVDAAWTGLEGIDSDRG